MNKIYANLLVSLLLVSLVSAAKAVPDVALVTALKGTVSRTSADGTHPLEAFTKLKKGDRLVTKIDAKLQILYFENGRQESWSGAGKLDIETDESRASGLKNPVVKEVPAIIVKQLSRTPALDTQGRAGVMRLRAIPSPDAISRIENTYQQMRKEAEQNDLNPELYLLSGMLELKQFERVEQVLQELQQHPAKESSTDVLISLYKKAVKNARESKP